MDKFVIKGGKKLEGRVKVSGAKNSSLALIPAALLNRGVNVFHNTPEVNDIFTMNKLLMNLGAEITFKDYTLKIDTSGINNQVAPYEQVKKMRASVYVLGPLLSKYGYAKVSLPGGCAWGPRPINLHLEAMKKLGAQIELEEGYIIAKANKLHGAKINFDISSVGATGNALMAAVMAKGSSLITNAATEPEITLLANYLAKMGAKIYGIGSNTLEIDGVDELEASEIANIGDRIEAGTLLIAGAITKGKIEIAYDEPNNLLSVTDKLLQTGCDIVFNNGVISLNAENINLNSVDIITNIFPGFPTDMQAQWTALMTVANGTSTITDNIYYRLLSKFR
ncbi:MAG TPA: UDP-N-acetylglucosamine 1-carboxyvinyltransferase, partial [Melioribacteraceae bacterium]|nr:UDP-N-acetylglucosamine 1-carboxyvinyltransferase [Melioribacteraceae bacterium]